jgi:hypothetical protein
MTLPFGITLWPPFDFGGGSTPPPTPSASPDPDETEWAIVATMPDPDLTVFTPL